MVRKLIKPDSPIVSWNDCGNVVTDDGIRIRLATDTWIADSFAKHRRLSSVVFFVISAGALLNAIPTGGAVPTNQEFTTWWIIAMLAAAVGTLLLCWSPERRRKRIGVWIFDRSRKKVLHYRTPSIRFQRIVAIALDVQNHEQTGAKEYRLDLVTKKEDWHGPIYLSLSLSATMRAARYISNETGIPIYDCTEDDEGEEPNETPASAGP